MMSANITRHLVGMTLHNVVQEDIINKKGAKCEPCGTPDNTVKAAE